MFQNYLQNPILGVYYSFWKTQQDQSLMRADLDVMADCHLQSIWLFFDPFYHNNNIDELRELLDYAHEVGLQIIPVLGQFMQLEDNPASKIVNADGTTSDNPRFWNMGCFRQPYLLERATARATGFFRDFGDHPALYRLDGKAVMSFVHEAYYRNNVPEFGGGEMQPSCYCDHCRAAFREYLAARGLDPDTEPPVDNRDPVVWQLWQDCHAEAIPDFLHKLITATKAHTPLLATHECNDFYPASWQSVYTGNDWWRMGAVLDFGHEDMYPLEFDTRYVCYVFNYAKDIMRSAMGFDGLITANGQAFNSWLGYPIPDNSMSEQVYSALAHGALGLAWWPQLWRRDGDEQADRYDLLRQTTQPNIEYMTLVKKLAGYQLARAKVALLYSWTTMSQELADNHSYDCLLLYMLLTQLGHPVDILSEQQVIDGVLQAREYGALVVPGCAALPTAVHEALNAFTQAGGLLIADYAPHLNDEFPPACSQWRGTAQAQARLYTLPFNRHVPIQLQAGVLTPPDDAVVLAHYADGGPAICQIAQGAGHIILAGSYLGWDYSNYPGYYDLGKMFPFHVRQEAPLRQFVAELLHDADIEPPATSTNPHVEVGVWHNEDRSSFIVLVINHLQTVEHTTVTLAVDAGEWTVRRLVADEAVSHQPGTDGLTWNVDLDGLQGVAFEAAKR